MIRLEFKTTLEYEDLIEDWCWQWNALSIDRQPNPMKSSAGDPDEGPSIQVRKVGALFETLDIDKFTERSHEFFSQGAIISIQSEDVPVEAWHETWRENFQAFSVGSFRVVPEWDGLEPDARTLLVYPGQAFGTGQHETTKLMLKALLAMDCRGKSVLDVGCGTGILAIAAEKRGAKNVFGFDLDPDCEDNMKHHLAINQTKRTKLQIGQWDDFSLEPVDCVLMNITINILKELWPKVLSVLKPAALVISSGILVEQAKEARQVLSRLGFRISEEHQEGEWCLIIAEKD